MKKLNEFFWGAATSSHQIEGNNTANDWWAWETAGKLKEPSGIACDSYNRFREDFDIISKLGHNSHRFSLEWSRLEPEEGKWNDEAFHHYEEVFKELKARGIEPFVTLHHFTNPQWFADKGGWLADDTVRYFVRYVNKAVKAFGKYVRFWQTINEPLVYLYHGFYAGLWPPGVKSYSASMKVFRHQISAHAQAYLAIHKYYENELRKPVWVSIAKHLSHFTPCRQGVPQDHWAVFLRSWFFNRLFIDAAVSGYLFFPGIFSEFLPAKHTLDFIGVNYYTRDFIRFAGLFGGEAGLGQICDKSHHQDLMKEKNMMGWEVFPAGLYHILKWLGSYHLPVIITENGIATENDEQRVQFIQNHLEAVVKAKNEGVPINGYFYWSLLDNFEWAHGFGPRFGIVDVNYQTQERKVRQSAHVLSDLCRNIKGSISAQH